MVTERLSPNRSSRRGVGITTVVVHGTAGKSDEGDLTWMADPKSRVSYHYLVGRDGTIYSVVPEKEKAWHAGRSEWRGTELVGGSLNACSVGVGLSNDGTGREPYPDPQVRAGARLVADICRRYRIPLETVRGHFEVSPGRKTDPWVHFPWDSFWRELGRASR